MDNWGLQAITKKIHLSLLVGPLHSYNQACQPRFLAPKMSTSYDTITEA
jgi:hypothetical protein